MRVPFDSSAASARHTGVRRVALLTLSFVLAAGALSTFPRQANAASDARQQAAADNGLRLLEHAVGGVGAIKPFQLQAHGERAEPLQGWRPSDVVTPSSFDLTATFDPQGQRERLSWQRHFSADTVAPGQTLTYDEIATPDAGYIEGNDVVFGQGSGGPMLGTRLGAIRRQQELLHPIVYLAGVLREGRAVRFTGTVELGGRVADVVIIDDQPRPVTMFFVGGSLVRLTTEESDFYLGDVKVQVDYADWRRVAGGRYPFRIDLSLDGLVIARQTVTSISADPAIGPTTFALPVTVPAAQQDVRIGRTNEQWFNRVLAFPFGAAFIQDIGQNPASARPIAPEVIVVPGAPAAAVSLAVNLGDSVVVAEPAINNDYSQQVIAAVQAYWPGKPISHIIATQWHFDTTGGIRQYAAIGADLIVPGEKRFFREILSRPHTIDPDLLSRTPTRPSLTSVGDDGVALGDGAVTVHRFSSAREAEMLLVCARDSKLAYTGDLFNPSFSADAPAPEPFRTWASDMYAAIQANCPWVQNVLGSHGLPQPEPIATLLAHAGLGEHGP